MLNSQVISSLELNNSGFLSNRVNDNKVYESKYISTIYLLLVNNNEVPKRFSKFV